MKAPADYLAALNGIRKITNQPGKASKATILQVQAALQKMLKEGALLPQKETSTDDNELADHYFNELNKSRR
ncbi:hypothetical protein [Paraflavitalea speifideaquila]|uniref:hypothetical protein n=1 Tax=Paraflavitalea speifideaquila TaxID=3076558 RepID=UPI0028EEEDF0|nr:hypothetical protein [Paraflavitalea speifideiaquila]